MATIAVALCVVAVFILQVPFPSLVEGAPRQKKIVLYQKEDHVVGTEYGMFIDRQTPCGFTERVNGENSRGEVPSYIRGYESSYAEDRPYVVSKVKKIFRRGDYTVQLHICEIYQDPKTTYALSTGNCDSLLRDNGGPNVQSVGRIYVSNNAKPRHDEANPIKFVAKLCQTTSGVLYGTVSLRTGFCHGRDRAVREYGFYAHGGAKFCPKLSTTYMTVTYESDGNGRETAANVGCTRGYRLAHGEAVRVRCGSDGRWEGSQPVCRQIVCPRLLQPTHGVFRHSGVVTGSTVNFECHPGYILRGQNQLTCNSDGSFRAVWNNPVPSCEAYDCGRPAAPRNGSVAITHGTTYNHLIRFSCNSGFRLIGFDYAHCTMQGWQPDLHICM